MPHQSGPNYERNFRIRNPQNRRGGLSPRERELLAMLIESPTMNYREMAHRLGHLHISNAWVMVKSLAARGYLSKSGRGPTFRVKVLRPDGVDSGRDALSPTEALILEMVLVGWRMARAGLGIQPTKRDMATWMGCSPNNVAEALNRLEDKGYIRRSGSRSRAIEVLKTEESGCRRPGDRITSGTGRSASRRANGPRT